MTMLPFTMQQQTKSNWCWAAVASSVADFYGNAGGWTQCTVADAHLGRGDCCGSPAGDPCNVPSVLDAPLSIVGRFSQMFGFAVSSADVVTEIADSRPVCLRVQWTDGSGHFLTVTGYAEEAPVTFVDDPIYGPAAYLDSALRTAYQGSGTWTHSYYTV
ncbi:papain-like cysteine protease family protein [Streptomyces sp. NPDC014894]|uniref:papain-like cysteine protease family protein n=1 Tax=unclassified Streptomyces TaxID=2593676 RepID=UPI0036FFF6AD